MNKIKILIAFFPIPAKWRGKIYRLISHGSIGKNFSLGYGSFINSNKIMIGESCSIGNLVRIKYLDKFLMGNHSNIGSSTVVCGTLEENKFKERVLKIGNESSILNSHYFDVAAPITIGSHVVIAGKGSQFYTHSFDLEENRMDGHIHIDDHVYIGAGCIVTLGVYIGCKVVIQAGTCVNSSITESGVYMSHTFRKRGNVKSYTDNIGSLEFLKKSSGKYYIYKK